MNNSTKKNVKKMLAFSLLSIAFLTSCQTVPDGIPPTGAIVDVAPPDDNKILTPDEAVEELTTALASTPLAQTQNNQIPTLTIAPTAAPEANSVQLVQLTVQLYKELLKTEVFDINIKGDQDYIILSTFAPDQTENMGVKIENEKVFRWQVKLNIKATGETIAERSVSVKVPVETPK